MTQFAELPPVPEKRAIMRRSQVDRKVTEAHAIVADAIEQHVTSKGKRLTGKCVLFSGGDDSTILAHLFRGDTDYFVHINTGICVVDEDSGESAAALYVRGLASQWDVPLIEENGESYDDLVKRYGFPGPGQHFRMYNNLKERGLRKVRRRLVEHGRQERVLFLAGMRRDESRRRSGNVEQHHQEGSIVWCSPLAEWTADDMRAYREVYPDTPRNTVSAELHMSGECLCGAFAKPGELDEIEFWRPATAARIRCLEQQVREAGNAPEQRCQWGWGNRERLVQPKMTGPLCSQCVLHFDADAEPNS